MKLAIQAIIMAGGEGVRLRPLTLEAPKPLVPLLGEPVMGYTLKLLKAHGINEVASTLWYQPKKIRAAFGKGEKYGVKLHYYEETTPLGTAGSVRMARDQLRDTFFVLSGDGLTDCDLTRALAFHKEKKALATLVLRRVSVPLPYGVVLTDESSRVTRFIEKPTWSRVFSDLVNTGIYILEPQVLDMIPAAGTPDFGKDIFPALLAKHAPLYGFETTGYWCDVGDQRAYLSAQQALLRGEVALPHADGVDATARIDPLARLEGLCQVGPGAIVGPGAVLRDAVIGEKCVIGAGALVEGSCLWPRAAVQEKASVRGCVLCDGAIMRQGAQMQDGGALGQGAIAGAYAELLPGVKIWPHLKAAPGAVISRSLTAGDFSTPQWTRRGAACDTAADVCALCAAYARVMGVRRVVVGHSGAAALQALTAGALGAVGARALTAGETTLPMLRALTPALGAEGGIFAAGQTLCFLDGQGRPLSSKQISAMDAALLRQEFPPAFAHPAGTEALSGAGEIYLARILPQAGARPLFSPAAVFCDSPLLRRLAAEGLERLNARDIRVSGVGERTLRPQETGFFLTENGEEFGAFTEDCHPSREQQTLLLLSLCARKNRKLFDLPGVPRIAARLAPLCEADESEACQRQRTLMGDGLAALFALAEELKQGPLAGQLTALPEVHILTEDVACKTRDKGRILHTLCDQTRLPHSLGEGVRIQHEKGYATIVPDAHRGMVRVMSESPDSEFAKELCDFYLRQIRNITEDKNLPSQTP